MKDLSEERSITAKRSPYMNQMTGDYKEGMKLGALLGVQYAFFGALVTGLVIFGMDGLAMGLGCFAISIPIAALLGAFMARFIMESIDGLQVNDWTNIDLNKQTTRYYSVLISLGFCVGIGGIVAFIFPEYGIGIIFATPAVCVSSYLASAKVFDWYVG